MSNRELLFDVRGLSVRFGDHTVVDDVSFTVHRGECIGLVGASGSGKSVTSLALLGLLQPGSAHVEGQAHLHTERGTFDLLNIPDAMLRQQRGRSIAMVFQEPMTALDPVYTVGEQVAEAVRLHLGLNKSMARRHVVELFAEVMLPEPEKLYDRYPHQLSGGQKQRVVIALALSCSPEVLVCDEPTTALDVLVQREVLDLLRDLQRTRHMGMVFITHDLGVVREVADRVLVMHQGRVVEDAPVETLFSAPQHAYTKGLLACRPTRGEDPRRLPTVEDFLSGTAGEHTHEFISSEERRRHVEALMNKTPLLTVEGLGKSYESTTGSLKRRRVVSRILEDIGFNVYPGETLGIVGGSGSGKTTLGRSILRLIEPTAGHVRYRGQELTTLSEPDMRKLRRELQIIFQDPYSALNPRITVGAAILEAMRVHGLGSDDGERRTRIVALLERVGLLPEHYDRFPHQFSGGQRQRIVIARAVALEPALIICDESIAALDVSVQAQVLNLLNELQEDHQLTYLFISHDLNVVRYFCDRILVLDHGKMVELGIADRVYDHPQAQYTRTLIDAIPGGKRDLGDR